MPQFIAILGPFGSGTSVMAQVLNSWGVQFPPPHFRPADPRTPNSYESHQLRDILLRSIDEPRMRRLPEQAEALSIALGRLREHWLQGGFGQQPLGLKHPLLALCWQELVQVFRPRLIRCTRPLAQIEASCQRRGWPARFGAEGARVLNAALDQLPPEQPVLVQDYADWQDIDHSLERLAAACSLQPDNRQWAAARALIRPSG